jgi:hypothetical protein
MTFRSCPPWPVSRIPTSVRVRLPVAQLFNFDEDPPYRAHQFIGGFAEEVQSVVRWAGLCVAHSILEGLQPFNDTLIYLRTYRVLRWHIRFPRTGSGTLVTISHVIESPHAKRAWQ